MIKLIQIPGIIIGFIIGYFIFGPFLHKKFPIYWPKARCAVGLHYWRKGAASYTLLGTKGRIETRICKNCGFKDPKGRFVPDEQV